MQRHPHPPEVATTGVHPRPIRGCSRRLSALAGEIEDRTCRGYLALHNLVLPTTLLSHPSKTLSREAPSPSPPSPAPRAAQSSPASPASITSPSERRVARQHTPSWTPKPGTGPGSEITDGRESSRPWVDFGGFLEGTGGPSQGAECGEADPACKWRLGVAAGCPMQQQAGGPPFPAP